MDFWVNIIFMMKMCVLTLASRYDLHKDILQSYAKGFPPNDTFTAVNMNFNAFRLISFDDKTGKFTISGFLEMAWVDPRIALKWANSSHKSPDIQTIYFKNSEVWTPQVLLANPHTRSEVEKMYDETVMVLQNGLAVMLKGDLFASECKADYTYFPFDTQNCSIDLILWGYYRNEVVLHPLHDTVNMELYEINNQWNMEDTRISQNNLIKENSAFQRVRMEFKISRRSTYYVLFLIMPIILMEILQTFVFLLPEKSGERVSFSVTILLSIAVYLTIVSEQIPKSSEPAISVLAKKLFADLCIGCVVQIFVIISQYTYTLDKLKDQKIEKVYCCDPRIWARKKDWTAIAYCLDITFAIVAVFAILASNLYLFGSFIAFKHFFNSPLSKIYS